MIPQSISILVAIHVVHLKVKASVLLSSVVTCRQLKSLSLESVNFTHEDLKVLLDNLPQLVTMEMGECEYEDGDIDASVNVSCGIDTSVKNFYTEQLIF